MSVRLLFFSDNRFKLAKALMPSMSDKEHSFNESACVVLYANR